MFNSVLGAPEAAASAPAVALWDVRKVYGRDEGAVVALNGVSLGLAAGSFTAVMGPSGSGKSTFLNVAAGLDRPTTGQVALGDTDLGQLSERRLTILRRERIGFVFQAFNLLPSLTVAQNIALPLRLDGRRAGRASSPRGRSSGRARQAPAPPSIATFRRPAAAGGDRPGPGHPTGGGIRRRAHGSAGHPHRTRRAGPLTPGRRPRRSHGRHGHP